MEAALVTRLRYARTRYSTTAPQAILNAMKSLEPLPMARGAEVVLDAEAEFYFVLPLRRQVRAGCAPSPCRARV